MRATLEQRLQLEAIDAYAEWRALCLDVRSAYERWAQARRSQARVAFRDYQHALIREEQASLKYALLVRCMPR